MSRYLLRYSFGRALLVAAALTVLAGGNPAFASSVTHYAYGLSPWSLYDVYRDGVRVASSVQASDEGTAAPRSGTKCAGPRIATRSSRAPRTSAYALAAIGPE